MGALDDAFRHSFSGGRVMVTAGVMALQEALTAVLAAVRASDAFLPDDDPHGEQDFGAVTVDRVRVFWKIVAHDRALARASPDPVDPIKTGRVLTVMLAEEH